MSILAILMVLTAAAPDDPLADLLDQYRDAKSVQQRAWLAPQIAATESDDARDFLSEAFLDATDRRLRRTLFVELFGTLPPLNARVERQCLTDADPYLRTKTLESVAERSPAEGVDRARTLLRYDEDRRVRAASMGVLCKDAHHATSSGRQCSGRFRMASESSPETALRRTSASLVQQ